METSETALPVMEATRLSIAEDIIHEGTTIRDEEVMSTNEDPYVNETSIITSAAGEEVMSTCEDPYANETSSISSTAVVPATAIEFSKRAPSMTQTHQTPSSKTDR